MGKILNIHGNTNLNDDWKASYTKNAKYLLKIREQAGLEFRTLIILSVS